ncbi:homeodomain-interacting protein kinase 2-like isoform X2 [Xyrichtys novacula]|uniref:Homeodomain-interacting protein kinase 2-like isoform X2 n=1 Tax=Xyrichtys novacula TaxID=13765 RepID=A0AAV1G3A2_XYRNO|nr:homeodomain-interacting protein kinase 2-like isoform X2 [Xyrichtys novacula]
MVALDALKGLGIVHCHIKPDNIMLLSWSQPFRVKLIDFGEAVPVSKLPRGHFFQPVGYRAPEVSLGLPLTEAIDMWGVGCVLASLFLADNPFPVDCDYLMMKHIVITLGQPEDHLLAAGENTHRYFKQDPWWNLEDPLAWRLLTPREYETENSRRAFLDDTEPLRSLEDLAHIYSDGDAAEMEDRLAFVDFLKDLLHLDGAKRISPSTALQHTYLTMSHQVMSPETTDDTTSVMGSSPTPHQQSAPTSGHETEDSGLSVEEEPPQDADCLSEGQLVESPFALSASSSIFSAFDSTSLVSEGDSVEEEQPLDADYLSEGQLVETPFALSASSAICLAFDSASVVSYSVVSDSAFPWSDHSSLGPDSVSLALDRTPPASDSASPASASASLASASTSRSRNLLKRVRSFFSRLKMALCCCCRAEED